MQVSKLTDCSSNNVTKLLTPDIQSKGDMLIKDQL